MQRRDYRRGVRVRRARRNSFWSRLSLNDSLIIVNVVVFVAIRILIFIQGGLSNIGPDSSLLRLIAINPSLFFDGMVWTLITSMFSHVLFLHLFVNMFSMFFIGNLVERLIGRKRYFWLYIAAGIGAGLVFVFLAWFGQFIPFGERIFGGFDTFALGASGALFGLGGLLAVLIPRLKVLVMYFIPMPMWMAMLVLLFGFWIATIGTGLPIGNTAHFGGLLIGVIFGLYLRRKYAKKVKALNRMIA